MCICMCIHIYMYICICICIYIYIICKYLCTYKYTETPHTAPTHTHKHARTSTHANTHTHTHTNTHAHARTQTYIHIHIHTHTHREGMRKRRAASQQGTSGANSRGVAVCRSMLQCVAVCCNGKQGVTGAHSRGVAQCCVLAVAAWEALAASESAKSSAWASIEQEFSPVFAASESARLNKNFHLFSPQARAPNKHLLIYIYIYIYLSTVGSLLTCSHLCSHIPCNNTIGSLLPCGCAWIAFWKTAQEWTNRTLAECD